MSVVTVLYYNCSTYMVTVLYYKCSTYMVTVLYYKCSTYVVIVLHYGGQDISVGIGTSHALYGQEFASRWWARYSVPVRPGPEAHRASCIMDTVSLAQGKVPRRGAGYPPRFGARCRL